MSSGRLSGENVKKTYKDLIEEAEAQIETWSVDDAKARKSDPNVKFVDLRDIRELHRVGKIPDAFHAPRGMLEFWVCPESPYHKDFFADEDATYVLYCQSGWRSALAAKAVQELGLTNVCHIGGGFGAWTESGGEVEAVEKK